MGKRSSATPNYKIMIKNFFQKNKESKSIIEPADQASYLIKRGRGLENPPDLGVIFLYQPHLLKKLEAKYKIEKVDRFVPTVFRMNTDQGQIGFVTHFGFGAPAVTVLMEQLIAFGVKRFISVGFAGGLQSHLKPGDLILAAEAVRDEGVSFHYLSPSEEALPSPGLSKLAEEVLKEEGLSFLKGMVWTTDAPFRETQDEFEVYRNNGVLAVEMETSALYAVGQCRDVDVLSLLTISDLLSTDEWQPNFHFQNVTQALEKLVDLSIKILKNTKN